MTMGDKAGHPKYGGRKLGSVNKPTKLCMDMAEELGINPFEILLRFAAGDWEGLGYDEKEKEIKVASGSSYYVDNIQASERIAAAKSAAEFLFPKRKAVELTGAEGKDLFKTFTEVVKAISEHDNS